MPKEENMNRFEKFLASRSDDALHRQQIITYLVAVGLVLVGVLLHVTGVIGSALPELRFLSYVFFFSSIVAFILWMCRKITLKTAYQVTVIIVQAVQTIKIFFISIVFPESGSHLIVMNGMISMMVMMLMAICYMRTVACFVGIANVITLIIAGLVAKSNILWQYIILISMFSLFFVWMTDMMYRNVMNMKEDNKNMHESEDRLMQILKLNRKEIKAYVEMCRTDSTDYNSDRLFGMLSERSQRNVINAVERKRAVDQSREEDIKEHFPDFTPMELEVSRLVLQRMKLSQIINITGKTESNISVVRSRIRKKLGLEAGEDLYDALQKRMKE